VVVVVVVVVVAAAAIVAAVALVVEAMAMAAGMPMAAGMEPEASDRDFLRPSPLAQSGAICAVHARAAQCVWAQVGSPRSRTTALMW
jgi:hypothetical protein